MIKGGLSFLDKLIDICMACACGILIFVSLLITVETLIRYFFGVASSELFEISEFTMLWMTFLGAGWVMKKNMNVKIDIVVNRLKGNSKTFLLFLSSILTSIILLFMTYYTFKITYEDFRVGTTLAGVLRPKKWPIEAIEPFIFFLLFLNSLKATYNLFTTLKRSE